MRLYCKYIFLYLFLIIFILSFSKNIFSQNNFDFVELNIIGENFFKTYYINFSNIYSPNSFKIYDI